jgi:hypothetical protein
VESIETVIVRLIGIGPQLNPVKRLREPLNGDGCALLAGLVRQEFVEAMDDVLDGALEAAAYRPGAALPGRDRIAARESLGGFAEFLDNPRCRARLGFLPGRSAPSPAFIVRVRALVLATIRVPGPAAAPAPAPRCSA